MTGIRPDDGGRELVRLARFRVALAELQAEKFGPLSGPIAPDQKDASAALDWALAELDERLAALEEEPKP